MAPVLTPIDCAAMEPLGQLGFLGKGVVMGNVTHKGGNAFIILGV